MTNILNLETSPYLLQHKDNPVHWMPWGKKALARAKAENKPILLSIGYAACHWCHVMAHESFEDDETAQVMNRLFVNIKVDREERPDIDQIYMEALTRLGEQGGWPLTMFLNSDGAPFWGGTYFPKESKFGRPAFTDLLNEVARVYREAPDKVNRNKDQLIDALTPKPAHRATVSLAPADLPAIAEKLLPLFDQRHGGISGAPKFPHFPLLEFMWRSGDRAKRDDMKSAVARTIQQICQGGIYDHLGGGMARYSVDIRWLAPHFEKMLYDNALFLKSLAMIWRETKNPVLKLRAQETFEWLSREMTSADATFAASLDADSEGEEGKFYVWQKDEITEILGSSQSEAFCRTYDVTASGNWEGTNILNLLSNDTISVYENAQAHAEDRAKLFQHRSGRIRPALDDKILVDWNSLMITALAEGSRIFQISSWLEAAQNSFRFISESIRINGRLAHSYRLGRAQHNATLEDYALIIDAALALYQATADNAHVSTAETFISEMHGAFWDETSGNYFFTADYADDVLVRMKNIRDDATPNGNAMMIANYTKLYFITGKSDYLKRAESIFQSFAEDALSNSFYHATFFNGFELISASTQIIVVATSTIDPKLIEQIYANTPANRIIVYCADTATLPKTHPAYLKQQIDQKPTLYLCRGTTCSLPVTDPEDLD